LLLLLKVFRIKKNVQRQKILDYFYDKIILKKNTFKHIKSLTNLSLIVGAFLAR